MYYKKAAMFGLDARIALAIFGALSIISGAVLYNVLEKAKVTALLTEMNEVGKAWEAYKLDTMKDLPFVVAGAQWTKTAVLVSNTDSIKGWNGPYLKYKISTSDNKLLLNKYGGGIHIITADANILWGEGSGKSWLVDGKCTSLNNCYIWIYFNGDDLELENINLARNMDRIIDNSDGLDRGNYRYISSVGGHTLKYIPATVF